MQAATQATYGAPDVLRIHDLPRPTVGDTDLLIEVHASAVTQGDRRLRSADFPGMSMVPGRLMMGVTRPKNPVPGTMFAGRVVGVGAGVTRFAEGDRVFGSVPHGAHAELLSIAQDGELALMPQDLSFEEAAAVPYGANTALVFLRDLAELKGGERVLVLGASGGVGIYAVQLARHLGADVTGVCSAQKADFVRSLGAHRVIDYATTDFRDSGEQYDVIFDTIGASGYRRCRASLTPGGRYLSLMMEAGLLAQVLWTSMFGGQRAIFGIAMGDAEHMDDVRQLVDEGALRPMVAERFPLDQIAQAHAYVEEGRSQGCVVVTVKSGAGEAAASVVPRSA